MQWDPDNVPDLLLHRATVQPGKQTQPAALPATDQHPDDDMRDGEALIQNVYNASRQNDALRHSSALVIIYDERGGIFDHVPPVPLPSPDNISSIAPPFDFKLRGVRVPAVVISPYIAPGTICSTVFDHLSVIATAPKPSTPSSIST